MSCYPPQQKRSTALLEPERQQSRNNTLMITVTMSQQADRFLCPHSLAPSRGLDSDAAAGLRSAGGRAGGLDVARLLAHPGRLFQRVRFWGAC